MSAIAVAPDVLDAFAQDLLRVHLKSPETAKKYRAVMLDVRRRLGITDLVHLTHEDLKTYLGRLYMAGIARSSQRVAIFALRAFYRRLVANGELAADPTQGIPIPKMVWEEIIPIFTHEEIDRLTFRSPPLPEPMKGKREPIRFFERRIEFWLLTELRDPALLHLMYDCALRGSEPGLLMRRDYDEKGRLAVRAGKWMTEPKRYPLLPETVVLMDAYLARLRLSKWAEHPALFPPIGHRRGDSNRGMKGIGIGSVGQILERRIARAEIQARGRKLTPHVFRYSRATHWREDGVSIEEISVLLRHSSLDVTRRYLRLGPVETMKKRADRRRLIRDR